MTSTFFHLIRYPDAHILPLRAANANHAATGALSSMLIGI
jgi:hypothetical protein